MKFIYFDLGKVLLDFDHEKMVCQMAKVAGVTPIAMRDALMPTGQPSQGDTQWQLEAGAIGPDDYYEHLCEALQTRPPREEFELAASDIFTPIEESFALVERLAAQGIRLGILSNTNAIHWDFFMDGRYPLLNEAFELKLSSFELKSMKPESAIYQKAAERAGVAPSEIFFTDDKPENIEGALSVGYDAMLFTTAGMLARKLRELGVDC